MCKEIQRSAFVAFSILTTFLEKALGDVCTQSLSLPFLLSASMADSLLSLSLSLSHTHTHTNAVCWRTQGQARVPCRINDLLVEPTLTTTFGPDAVIHKHLSLYSCKEKAKLSFIFIDMCGAHADRTS